jgi:hypothetical protein
VEQAGAMPVDAITALQGLDDTLGLAAGESVGVLGADAVVDGRAHDIAEAGRAFAPDGSTRPS